MSSSSSSSSSSYDYDVVVVGGGMMGLVYACNVKKERPNTSVLVLERALHPRYKVGESTLSAVVRMMFRLGMSLGQMEALFENKGGLMFYHTDVDQTLGECLETSLESVEETFQFDRRVIETILLELAEQKYQVVVRCGCTVLMNSSDIGADGCTIEYGDGSTDFRIHRVHCKMVCDASGRGSLLVRRMSPADFHTTPPVGHFDTNTYWGYYKQVSEVPLETWQLPNTRHVCFPGGWAWILRLNSYHQASNANVRSLVKHVLNTTDEQLETRNELSARFSAPCEIVYSIGIVVRQDDEEEKTSSWTAAEKFAHYINKYPMLREIMKHYEPINGVSRQAADSSNDPLFSPSSSSGACAAPTIPVEAEIEAMRGLVQYSTKPCGDGWISCGDALGFTNPFLSPGMTFGVATAAMAAYTTVYALDQFVATQRIRNDECFDLYEKYATRLQDALFTEYRLHYLMFNHRRTFERCLLGRLYFALNDTASKTTLATVVATDSHNKPLYAPFDSSDCAPLSVFFPLYIDTIKHVNAVMLRGEDETGTSRRYSSELCGEVETIMNNALATMKTLLDNKLFSGAETYLAHYNSAFERQEHRHFLVDGVVWFVRCDECGYNVDGTRDACPVCAHRVVDNSEYECSIPVHAERTLQVTHSSSAANETAKEIEAYFKGPYVMRKKAIMSRMSSGHEIVRLRRRQKAASSSSRPRKFKPIARNLRVNTRNDEASSSKSASSPPPTSSPSPNVSPRSFTSLLLPNGGAGTAGAAGGNNNGHLSRPRPRTPPSHRRRQSTIIVTPTGSPPPSEAFPPQPLLAAAATAAAAAANNSLHDVKRITIVYATESGTSRTVAQSLGVKLTQLQYVAASVRVIGVEQYNPMEELPNEQFIVFITSTFGDGDAPSTAQPFKFHLSSMKQRKSVMLNDECKYCVLGLGSSLYRKFCGFAQFVDTAFESLGATRFMAYATADARTNQDQQVAQWQQQLIQALHARFSASAIDYNAAAAAAELTMTTKCPFKLVTLGTGIPTPYYGTSVVEATTLLTKINELRVLTLAACNDHMQPIVDTLDNIVRTSVYDASTPLDIDDDDDDDMTTTATGGSATSVKTKVTRDHPVVLRIRSNDELMDLEETDRSVRKITLELGPLAKYMDGLEYEHGDTLGLYPVNAVQHVKEVARLLRVKRLDQVFKLVHTQRGISSIVHIPFTREMTYFQALSCYVDIDSAPTQRFIQLTKEFASDAHQIEELNELSTNFDHYTQWVSSQTPTMLNFLLHFSSLNIPLADFFGAAPLIQPRYYSVSSSPLVSPTSVTITVAINQFHNSCNRLCHGVASHWLKKCEPKTTWDSSHVVSVFFQPTTFKLPRNPKTPIIMVGIGSGIAPFRSFWEERMKLQETGVKLGVALLFFGCRRAAEHIYYDEMEEMVAKGVLNVHVAYSRDTESSKDSRTTHVQDIIARERDEVVRLIVDMNASVYVCGYAGAAQSARTAIINALKACLQWDQSSAMEYLESMTSSGRLPTELFGASSSDNKKPSAPSESSVLPRSAGIDSMVVTTGSQSA